MHAAERDRWFYNKEIFSKVGITSVPTTWSQLLADCARLKKAGYIPLALAGDYATLWAGNGGWLFRMYADQYARSLIKDERSRPGDYTYDQTIDSGWKYDPQDPFNDDANKVTASEFQLWYKVAVPLSWPILMTIAILSMVNNYRETPRKPTAPAVAGTPLAGSGSPQGEGLR